MKISNTLFAKLTAALLLLIVAFGGAILVLSNAMSEMYNQEVMQRLNQSVAMYVADQQPLLNNGNVNEQAMDELAERAMILNPSLEIYLLDPEGNVLSHRLPEGSVQTESVDIGAVSTFLEQGVNMPVLGTDPRMPEKENVFSAAPLMQNNQTQGFVYAVIGGDTYQALRDSAENSYAKKISTVLIVTATLIAAIIGGTLFYYLTRRLTRLRKKVTTFGDTRTGSLPISFNSPSETNARNKTRPKLDEIRELEESFQRMADQIDGQFEALEMLDKTKRELIANVSHDLRTPLASMQGYIETLIIKNNTLDDEQRKAYLETAHKHSQRLAGLINELFELAKLESNTVEPNIEQFSLLELVHDCAQEFTLKAEGRNIDLEVQAKEDCFVSADIALIHRVLQNLLDNAIQHTPESGKVSIKVERNQANARVEVSDTGRGIQTHEIPYIFDRFYQAQHQERADKIGTGLGLAIVKRILDLHQSAINVKSQPNKGTSFTFELPQFS